MVILLQVPSETFPAAASEDSPHLGWPLRTWNVETSEFTMDIYHGETASMILVFKDNGGVW